MIYSQIFMICAIKFDVLENLQRSRRVEDICASPLLDSFVPKRINLSIFNSFREIVFF